MLLGAGRATKESEIDF
ncbi:hypothetical protein ACT4US_13390 [Bacillus sp. HC-Mk]